MRFADAQLASPVRRRRQLRLLRGLLAAVILAGAAGGAAAQDTPSWNRPVPKESAKPPAKAPARPPRPRPARRPPASRPPATHELAAPLLSIQYRILKVNADNSQVEVSPLTVFNRGDRLRIAVKANQDVFLYVIHQKAANLNGVIFVPDSQINSGQNFVTKNREFVIPSGCPASVAPQDCAYVVDARPGQEYFTMIFSRSAAIDLTDETAAPSSEIRPQTLIKLIDAANQKLNTQGRGDSIFSLRFNNTNPAANNQIIVRYALTKRA